MKKLTLLLATSSMLLVGAVQAQTRGVQTQTRVATAAVERNPFTIETTGDDRAKKCETDMAVTVTTDNKQPLLGDSVKVGITVRNKGTEDTCSESILTITKPLAYIASWTASFPWSGVPNPAPGYVPVNVSNGNLVFKFPANIKPGTAYKIDYVGKMEPLSASGEKLIAKVNYAKDTNYWNNIAVVNFSNPIIYNDYQIKLINKGLENTRQDATIDIADFVNKNAKTLGYKKLRVFVYAKDRNGALADVTLTAKTLSTAGGAFVLTNVLSSPYGVLNLNQNVGKLYLHQTHNGISNYILQIVEINQSTNTKRLIYSDTIDFLSMHHAHSFVVSGKNTADKFLDLTLKYTIEAGSNLSKLYTNGDVAITPFLKCNNTIGESIWLAIPVSGTASATVGSISKTLLPNIPYGFVSLSNLSGPGKQITTTFNAKYGAYVDNVPFEYPIKSCSVSTNLYGTLACEEQSAAAGCVFGYNDTGVPGTKPDQNGDGTGLNDMSDSVINF